MAVDFIPLDRGTPDWFPATVQEYLPGDHLARFVVEIVDQLDLGQLVAAYAGTDLRSARGAGRVGAGVYRIESEAPLCAQRIGKGA